MTEQTPTQDACLKLDGHQLKQLLLAGMSWLEQHYQIVNQLNVFPVPDGDTGINMLLTMQSAYAEVAELDEPHVGSVVRRFAKGAVNGSRGNSGVILSQIWRGFGVALRESETVDASGLASALQMGTTFAYDAAPKPPREGTILTVVREVAERAQVVVREESDIVRLFEALVVQANETLQRTPELLPILKEAGVIDSGGQGLTYILEGMLRQLRGESLESDLVRAAAAAPARKLAHVMSATEFGHPYDVQLLLTGEKLDVDRIRAAIQAMGDSAIVTSDGETTVKIHVHVYDPGQPISYAVKLGVVSDVVVENMYEQYLDNIGASQPVQAPPMPSVELQPDDVAVIAVAPGDGLARIFYEQGAARLVSGGQTMNPSTEEIYKALSDVPVNKAIILPNNGNIILAAQQAVRKARNKEVVVVPSKNVPQGIAAMLFYANARLHEDRRGDLAYIAEGMTAALDDVVSGEVTVAVRSVEMDGVRARAGQVIGLLEGKIVAAHDDLSQLMHDLIGKLDRNAYELVTLYYGADVRPKDAEALAEVLASAYDSFTFEVIPGGQPHYFYLLSIE
ncbi:MAG: DAK2 domain-containing protein [Anaerolineae bacterium]|nr:DAK2 domain-containing protein [Anaerolineae bacterium]